MKILIVDLSNQTVSERSLDDPLLGGRLLTAQLVTEFIDPHIDPIGADNALILAAGALAGLPVSTSGRLSIGSKSPLTRGIKESNAGGMAADTLAYLGYRAIVFIGALTYPGLFILDEQGAHFADARAYWGHGNESTAQDLARNFGSETVVVSIGQAGEQLRTASAIAVTDAHGKPFRMAARGGLGAVMGSKRLKAILLRRPRQHPANALTREAKGALVAFNKHVSGSDRIEILRDYGTASTVAMVQILGGMVVNNFSRGQHHNAEAIGGEQLRDTILERGGVGTPTEACMRGCVIQCSNIFPNAEGQLAVAPLEFETIGLCGANLGLNSLDDIACINRLCNDAGLDTIEVGAALGVMMEANKTGSVPAGYAHEHLPRFGDIMRAAELVAEISHGTPLGKLLGDGAVATGEALGVKRVPAVKGQAISAYDPRVVKGTGVTYATSPQGADHTAGLTVFARADHRDPQLAVSLSRASQIQRAAYDALGLCVFNISATGQQPTLVINMLRLVYGIELPDNWLDDVGRRVIEAEIAYNRAAGFTAADDRLPEFFTSEALPPTNSVFDVAPDALDHIWDR